MVRSLLPFLRYHIVLFSVFVAVEAADKCTLCMDSSTVPSPNNLVYDADSGYNETCSYHNSFIQSIFPPESTYCKYAQSGGLYLCDCKVPKTKCQLCSVGDEGNTASSFLDGEHEIEDGIRKSDLDGGDSANTQFDEILTCFSLWINLAVYVQSDTQECWDYQRKYATQCGCQKPETLPFVLSPSIFNYDSSNSNNLNTNAATNITNNDANNYKDTIINNDNNNNNPTSTTTTSSTPSSSICRVCESEEEVMLYPEREFEFDIYQYYVDESMSGFSIHNCGELDFWASVLPGLQSDMCTAVTMMSSYCGCHRGQQQDQQELEKEETSFLNNDDDNNVCTLCSNGLAPRYPLKTLNWNDKDLYHHMSFRLPVKRFNCGMFDSIMRSSFDEGGMGGISEGQYCLFAHFRSTYCGCDVDWKSIIIIWCFRISGFLSLLGSSFVIYSVCQKKKKLNSTYHQILLGLSIFDIFGSFMYVLCTTLTPIEDGMFGAMGNISTCKAQGFFLQLGLTSAFFNALLSLYFYLMICQNWKERKFTKYRMYAYAFVIFVGLLLAFTGLQYYYTDMLYLYCYIRPPPAEESFFPILLWNVVPVAFVFLFMSVNTALLVHAVRKQHLKSNKWNFRGSSQELQPLERRSSWTTTFSRSLRRDSGTTKTQEQPTSTRRGSGDHLGVTSSSMRVGRRNSIMTRNKKKNGVMHRVLWQSIYYLLSYTITLPILMLRSMVHLSSNEYMNTSDALFMWNVIIALLCPAQGIFNAMIFYNRESSSKKKTTATSTIFSKCCCCFFKKKEKKEKTTSTTTTLALCTQFATEVNKSSEIMTTTTKNNNPTIAAAENTATTIVSNKKNLLIEEHVITNNDPEILMNTASAISTVDVNNNDDDLGSECEAALEFLELTKDDGEIKLFTRRS